LLSRRTNLKSPAEIEAERRAFRAKPAEPFIRESVTRPARPKLTPEQRAERNSKILQLWMSKSHTVSEIASIVDCSQGLVQSVIADASLWGKGGVRRSRIKPSEEAT
jgi:hypothetical protein